MFRRNRRRARRSAARWAMLPILLVGCAPPPPPPPPPPPAPPPPEPYVFPYGVVWSAKPEVTLVADSVSVAVPRPFTRLEVLEADTAWLRLRCAACEGAPEGRVEMGEVVFEPLSPAAAAERDLASFALAVRDAAGRRDVRALRPVMAPDFTFSFVGLQGAEAALVAWAAEGFQSLERVPALLDRGLATRDSLLWTAPPEHFERLDYRGFRLGFRRLPEGRWEWVFLVRSEIPAR